MHWLPATYVKKVVALTTSSCYVATWMMFVNVLVVADYTNLFACLTEPLVRKGSSMNCFVRFVGTYPWTVVGVAAALSIAASAAQTPVPPVQPPGTCAPNVACKVITLDQQELQALTGQNMVLDTAEQGRPLDLGNVVKYFRNKFTTAPDGLKAEEKK